MKALCAPTRAQEIADNLETALAQFKAIATKLSLQCIAPERGRGALIRSGSRLRRSGSQFPGPRGLGQQDQQRGVEAANGYI